MSADLKRKPGVRASKAWQLLDYLKELADADPENPWAPDRPLSSQERERYPYASKRKSLAEIGGAKFAIRLAELDADHGYKFSEPRKEHGTGRMLYCYRGQGLARKYDPTVERRLVVLPKECVALLYILEGYQRHNPESFDKLGLNGVLKKLEQVKKDVYGRPQQPERRDLA